MKRKRNKKKTITTKDTFTFDERSLRELFEGCEDVIIRKMSIEIGNILIISCEGLYDQKALFDYVLNPLQKNNDKSKGLKEVLSATVKELGPSVTKEHIVEAVFIGKVVLLHMESSALWEVEAVDHPKRSVEEPNTEVSIRGSKEGFVEEIKMNTALVRKRMRSSSLKVATYVIGERTKTTVQLLYMEDITNKKVIKEVQSRLEKINIDGLESSLQIEELIGDTKKPLFPLFAYTGRPDYVIESLLHGRFAILMDGTPTALIAPVNLFFILKTAEDHNVSSIFVFFERMMRVIGLYIALFLPAFWIALISFHPDQLPFTLLATVTLSRDGVPFSAAVECFMMLFLFEMFREAGVRLPTAIGQILSVVGGLIIGQAAIAAGFTAPGILVVNAIALVATFTLINQSLTGLVGIIRLIILFITSLFGMFGFFLCMFALVGYLAGLRSFGIPYLSPLSPPRPKEVIESFWHSANDAKRRPKMLKTIDFSRKGRE
ncbi:spore germination protein [Halobacillus sp. MO56]